LVVETARKYRANYVILERNTGHDLLGALFKPLKCPVPIREVDTRDGKMHKSIPIAQLYELERVFHHRRFRPLEQQLLSWDPNAAKQAGRRRLAKSPDRMDAACMAIAELKLEIGPALPMKPIASARLPSTTE
jgi:phage terminase large subunit-like protein